MSNSNKNLEQGKKLAVTHISTLCLSMSSYQIMEDNNTLAASN